MAWNKGRNWTTWGGLRCCSTLSSSSSRLRGFSKIFLGNGIDSGRCGNRLLAFACGILSISYFGYCLGPPSLTEEPLVWGMLGTKTTLIGMEAHGGWQQAWVTWRAVRSSIIAPILQGLANVVTWLFVVQLADILVLCFGRALICLTGFRYRLLPSGGYGALGERGEAPASEKTSEKLIGGATGVAQSGATAGVRSAAKEEELPKVLVQIPMCNERECYEQSMAAACGLDWPADRVLIQVLDDSDDAEIRRLISGEVSRWQARGFPIVYLHRLKRIGHKAGNLRFGMEEVNGHKEFDFVAIFDADFMPTSDFLRSTVPHFRGRPDLALVQARWTFVNARQNVLTRLQDIAECYHFEIEQQVMSYMTSFFGFNGTAGVWRLSALEQGGGWEHRTTVEDMDMAVRAHLNGWRFIFLNRVETLCELPSTYASYCKQQHRWFAGPMQLFRLTFRQTLTARHVALWKKANLLVSFFWLRKLLLPVLTFLLFFVLLPASIIVPELQIPLWASVGVPVLISWLHCVAADARLVWLLVVPNLLFENVMALTKAGAIAAGLLGTKSMSEWVVTQKSGSPPKLLRALTPSRACTDAHNTVAHVEAAPAGGTAVGLRPASQCCAATRAVPACPHVRSEGAEESKSLTNHSESFTAKQNGLASGNIAENRLGQDGVYEKGVAVLSQESESMLGNGVPCGKKPKLTGGFCWPGKPLHLRELLWGAFLMAAATCSLAFLDGRHSWLLGLQGVLLLATGSNLLER